ncbi:hypothetical protein HBA55_05065 [Pseudomaricurvus alkylphenolicus]|uniref:CoA transferase n=1 Tax=Pseudomaricurvus alkylphenolicus TaxID=1306991 RepID=UPI00141EC189|nr:CoA transferase [Pseudomaricurvus alkylphenolicus]NIB38945.1 hypothetical protein [Pseudomaricurvus alkylphenolicus]
MKDATAYKGPLAGLKVVDFGHYYAGPMAAMLLADQGADVVRVIRPGACELSEAQHRVLNRNKRLLTLDLKTAEGKERAMALVRSADVLIENFRPGVMATLGLSYPAVKAINPSLVYLSLPGFSAKDSARAHIQAWEGVLCAATSLYAMDPLRNKFGFPPHYMKLAPCSAFGAMHGVVAVLAGLHARSQHSADNPGGGIYIETPLAAAGLSTCTRGFIYRGGSLRSGHDKLSQGPLPEALQPLVYSRSDDQVVAERKLKNAQKLMPKNFVTHAYRSKDERLMMFMPIKPEMAHRFFRVLGIGEQLQQQGFVIHSPWNPEEATGIRNLANAWELTAEDSAYLIDLIQAQVAHKTADECQQLMLEASIPFSYVRSREQWLTIPELAHAGMFVPMGEGRDRITTVGRTVDVTGPGERVMGLTADADFREPVDTSWEQLQQSFLQIRPGDDQQINRAETLTKGKLLQGVKVIDLCNVVAGPNAAYTLAQYGAEVIRIEPPKSFNLPMHLGWTLEVNQGKRSMVLDTRTEAGRTVFERLLAEADIVLHNRLQEVAQRLGFSAPQLKAINPKVIVCQVSAFGATEAGGWEAMPGYDPNPNMTSGLEASRGTIDSPSQVMEIFTDLMGGLSLAFSSLLALYQQGRTGFAGSGFASLARGCNFYQLPQLISGETCSGRAGSEGWFAYGECWYQRLYACCDKWLYVGALPADKEVLAELVGGRSNHTQEQLEQGALEAGFLEQNAEYWYATLSAAGIGCHPVLNIDELCHGGPLPVTDNQPAILKSDTTLDFACFEDHPCGLPMILPLPAWVRCGEDLHYQKLSPTPKVGQHTRQVLQELGYTETQIAEFYEQEVAWDYLPAIGNRNDYFFVQKKREE